ncbi:hypothetical protein MNV49_007998, partial [Pseudohyphozyma bogoriensis]
TRDPEEHREHVRQVLQVYATTHSTPRPKSASSTKPKSTTSDSGSQTEEYPWTRQDRRHPQLERAIDCKGVRGFLGFANFYRRFILDYSRLAKPLYDLLKKDVPFIWSPACESAFADLKHRFTTAPILRHFDKDLPTRMETDASDFAIGAILLQCFEEQWYPLAFISRTLNAAERNYDTHDKEMLAIVFACIEWRPLLLSLSDRFEILSDHRSLEWFMSTKSLNRRQTRWAERLSDFAFTLTYRSGAANTAADALSRAPPTASDDRPYIPDALLARIQKEQDHESLVSTFSQAEQEKVSNTNGTTLFDGRIVIPESDDLKLEILRSRHDHPTAGHPGVTKTLQLVRRDFYWRGVRKYVEDYVSGCTTCARTKAPRHKKYGLLQPLPIPEHPWASISMDFIEKLPESDGYDSILVVDRLTKMAVFIPTDTTITAQELADIFIRHVFSKHGLPADIISDRGNKFTSQFWTALSQALKIQQNLSTAYHPETDGQTERINSILETYLRLYVNYDQDDWSRFLPLAEFAYNNATHSATGLSPFFANKGFHPLLDIEVTSTSDKIAAVEISKIKDLHDHAKDEIKKAIAHYEENANRRRQESPEYQVGDRVMLSAKNIRTTQPTKKLSEKQLGPFTISQIVSPLAVQLDLPQHLSRIHPVFHVSLLTPIADDRIPGRRQPPPEPVEVVDESTGWSSRSWIRASDGEGGISGRMARI